MSETPSQIVLDPRDPNTTHTVRTRTGGPGVMARGLKGLGRGLRNWGYTTGLYGYRLGGRHPLQLLGSPDDPAPGDAAHGRTILGGDMRLPGGDLVINDAFWRTLSLQDDASQSYAHSFHWLQDLAQVSEQARAAKRAEGLISQWFPFGERFEPTAWAPETLARRLINWIAHAPLVLSRGDLVYKSRVLGQMARQSRHLMRVCTDARPGLGHIYTASALMLAGLLLPGGKAWAQKGQRLLLETLDGFILADGGPRSRNPSDAVKTMQQLILVRDALVDRDCEIPAQLISALDRIAPFVRALRHDDGAFAQMNGASAEGGHGTDAILAASEARGRAIEPMIHSGYQRVTKGKSVLIVDTGPPPGPPLDREAHAATGALEFSHGSERVICNMGHHSGGDMAQLCRTTAAHSLLVLGNRNSSALDNDGHIGRGVRTTEVLRRETDEGVALSVSHDGYQKRFKAQVERRLFLASDGRTLRGEDKVRSAPSSRLTARDLTLWFHLAPGTEVDLLDTGDVALTTAGGHIWHMTTSGTASIEPSLHLPSSDTMSEAWAIAVTVDTLTPVSWQLDLHS